MADRDSWTCVQSSAATELPTNQQLHHIRLMAIYTRLRSRQIFDVKLLCKIVRKRAKNMTERTATQSDIFRIWLLFGCYDTQWNFSLSPLWALILWAATIFPYYRSPSSRSSGQTMFTYLWKKDNYFSSRKVINSNDKQKLVLKTETSYKHWIENKALKTRLLHYSSLIRKIDLEHWDHKRRQSARALSVFAFSGPKEKKRSKKEIKFERKYLEFGNSAKSLVIRTELYTRYHSSASFFALGNMTCRKTF